MGKVIKTEVEHHFGAPPDPDAVDDILNGVLIGLNSDGQMVVADRTDGAGLIAARGFCLENAVIKDFRGNAIQVKQDVSYTRAGKVEFSNLTPGATYWLSSGGVPVDTVPATAGDLAQEVGYAESATVLVIAIGTPAVI